MVQRISLKARCHHWRDILQQATGNWQPTCGFRQPLVMGTIPALASVLLLAAHLVTMNVASAAPLVCVWLRYRERRSDAAAGAIGRRLASWSWWSFLAGIMLGLMLLGTVWAASDQCYWQAVARFPTGAYLFAASELAFTAACLALYAGLWSRLRKRPWWHALLAVLATTNLFYHFPPLMIVLAELSAQPEWISEPMITRPVFRSLLLRSELIGKLLHFGFASVAVSGASLMLLARWHAGAEVAEDCRSALIRIGAGIAFAASVVQLAVGIWVLLELPTSARNALLGDDWLGTVLFFLSIVATLGMLRVLGGVAGGDTSQAAVTQSIVLLIVVVVLMTGSLTRSRQGQSRASPLLTARIALPQTGSSPFELLAKSY